MANSELSARQHERMMNTPMPRLIAAMALPTTLSQLVTVIYNTADTYFVSKVGTSATAAVGVVFSLMSIIQAVGYGIGMGANSIISRELGARNDEKAHESGSSAMAAALLFGIAIMIAGLSAIEPIMRALGSTETILPYACDYAWYILISAPTMCSSFVLNCLLRAQGMATLAMWGLCTGGILNIVLDPLLIFGLNMGISGAALATSISQLVSFIILLSEFVRGRCIVKLRPRYVSRHIKDYLHIMRMGLPTICRQGLGSLSSALINTQGAAFGDAALAALTIANKAYTLMRGVVVGIGQGFQPVAGYNYGAGSHRRVREAFRVTCAIGTVFCIGAAIAGWLGAHTIAGWFSEDPEVIELCVRTLYCLSIVTPLMAYSTYVNQLYQSLGFSAPATFLASCRQGVFFVPLILALPPFMKFDGVMLAQPGSDLMTFLIALPFQIIFFKKVLSEDAKPAAVA